MYGAVAGLQAAMEEGGAKPKETPKPKPKKKAAAEGKAKKGGGDGDGGTPAPKRQKAAEGKAPKAAGAQQGALWSAAGADTTTWVPHGMSGAAAAAAPLCRITPS